MSNHTAKSLENLGESVFTEIMELIYNHIDLLSDGHSSRKW